MGLGVGKVTVGAEAAALAALEEPAATAGSAAERLRVHICSGEAFVCALAASPSRPADFGYDLVVVDVACPGLPEAMAEKDGAFARALAQLLRPCAGVAVNLLIGASGTGPSGGRAELAAAADAFKGAAPGGEAFSVHTPLLESANTILGFSTAPAALLGMENLQDALHRKATALETSVGANFDMGRRLSLGFTEL